uniref:Chromosome 1 open reading frame, human C16orf95 n=1 Tax=Monodelphis domestica TaxID=13616 RepID=A0A5F8GM67_MONDO
MISMHPRRKEHRELNWNPEVNKSILRNKHLQDLKADVTFVDFKDPSCYGNLSHLVPECCHCYFRPHDFGGFLPVPRNEANFPYWVPRSLRSQKPVHRKVRFSVPENLKTCTCPCHSFGGHLPVPREFAPFPYWVPQSIRLLGKIKKNSASPMWTKGNFYVDNQLYYHYKHWRVCCDDIQLSKWQKIQAIIPQPITSWAIVEEEECVVPFVSPWVFFSCFYNLMTALISALRGGATNNSVKIIEDIVPEMRSLEERKEVSETEELKEMRAKEKEKRKEERIRVMRILATSAGDCKREEEAKMEQLFQTDDEFEHYDPEDINGTFIRSKKKASGMDNERKESKRKEGLASGIQGVASECLPHFHGCWRVCSEGSRLDMLLNLQSQFRDEASKRPYMLYKQPDEERTLPVFVLGIVLGSIRSVASAMRYFWGS